MAQNNTVLDLIKTTIEKVQNEDSLFSGALEKLVNSTEEELDNFLNRNIFWNINQGILRLISGDKVLKLKALDGSRLICKAKNTFKSFKSFIDINFIEWEIINPGIATPETLIQVHEMIGNSQTMDIFRVLPGAWSQKWLSQHQVIEFCKTLPEWLGQEGYSTFFLLKKDENKPIDENNPEDNLVVALVTVLGDGLDVCIYRIGFYGSWEPDELYHVVVPQFVDSVI